MEIAITGGTGFVGSHLSNRLAEEHSVTAISRTPDETPIPLDDEVKRVEGDVTNQDSLDFDGYDAVVHLVALSPLFKQQRGRHMDVHFEGTRNVVEEMRDSGVDRLIHMSALGVDRDVETEYLRAKQQAEELVRNSGLDWTVFRPSVIFGEGSEFVKFTKLLTTPYITGLPGGGKSKFQLIWIGDLTKMFAQSLNNQTEEVYEIGGPEIYTLAEATRLVYRADGKPVKVLPIPMPLAKIGLTLADSIPFIPIGIDQYKSLALDSVTQNNDAEAFGFTMEELRSFRDYLGLE